MVGTWKLSAKPWVLAQGPDKGNLECVTITATSGRITRNLLLQNHGLHLDQLKTCFIKVLSNELVPGILATLRKDNVVDFPGHFTNHELFRLGFQRL